MSAVRAPSATRRLRRVAVACSAAVLALGGLLEGISAAMPSHRDAVRSQTVQTGASAADSATAAQGDAATSDTTTATADAVWLVGDSPTLASGEQPVALSALVLEGTGLQATGPSYAGLGHPSGQWAGSLARDAVADGWSKPHARAPRLIWQFARDTRYSPYLPYGLNLLLPVGHSMARSGTWKLEARWLDDAGNYTGAWRPLPDIELSCSETAGGVRYRFLRHPFLRRTPGGVVSVPGPLVHCTSAGARAAGALFEALLDYDLPSLTDPASVVRLTPISADEFEALPLRGSDPISRAGHLTKLSLGLGSNTGEFAMGIGPEPVAVTEPIANAAVGMRIAHGPSRGAEVMCLAPPTVDVPSPGYSGVCVTDADGRIAIRWLVPQDAAHALRRGQDTLLAFIDHDRDRAHDDTPGRAGHEPAATLEIDIAKAVSYVALGDSYSSGENGRAGRPGFTGRYLTDNPAGAACRRWDRAWPVVLADSVLGNKQLNVNLTFDTFACTGAETVHIFDPLDPDETGTGTNGTDSRRPSGHAPAVGQTGWEPRQSVSLATAQATNSVDLVTITVGGNDAGFAEILMNCVLPGQFFSCDDSDLPRAFSVVAPRIRPVISRIRAIAPEASVFVLGYPYITPTLPQGCDGVDAQTIGEYERFRQRRTLERAGLSKRCQREVMDFVTSIEGADCAGLRANQIYHARPGWASGIADLAGYLFSDRLNIRASEAIFLKHTADRLNAMIREAAMHAGVHFVDVNGARLASGTVARWNDRSTCSARPWMHGFVADDEESEGASGESFHPTAEGHETYAAILDRYIRERSADGAALSDAGLPLNPDPSPNTTAVPGPDRPQLGQAADAAPKSKDSESLLRARQNRVASGCGSPFSRPATSVTLAASGFAPGAAVTFETAAASLGDAEPAATPVAAATADTDGRVTASWMLPSSPLPTLDAAPRGYAARATGANPSGGVHTTLMSLPLVVYPGTAPCAKADAAATTMGQSVDVAVLSNDITPSGGSLDASSVRVRSGEGGVFDVDAATGVVRFTPAEGYWGTVSTTYVVYDRWGVGVEADLTITVNPGCTIVGTTGVALIEGTDGDDVICVPDRDDWRAFHIIDAKGGDDVILGGAGVEWIYGGGGDDTIHGNGGDDRIVAGAGTDTIRGGPGTDHIYSTDLIDTVIDERYETILTPTASVHGKPVAEDDWSWAPATGTALVDVLSNDHDPDDDLDPGTLRITKPPASGTATVAPGGSGRPVISFDPAGSGEFSISYEVCDSLAQCAQGEATVTVGTTGCTIVGTAGDDTLRGTPGDDFICGLGGNDTIMGLDGDDIIIGGPGDDTVHGGGGNDTIWGGIGNDRLRGGAGDDTVWGAAGRDRLWAHAGNDRLHGGAGNDTITGGNGRDLIWGGPGNDTIRANRGRDRAWGGNGADTLYGGSGRDALWGGPGNDTIWGDDGDDTIWGGNGDDALRGLNGDDTIWGGPGNDTIRGGDGDDTIRGGPGDDTIRGGDGRDHLAGGLGNDSCKQAASRADCASAPS